MRSGRPREPGKAFKNVGGFASPPTFLKAFPGPRGRPDLKKSGQAAFRYPECFDEALHKRRYDDTMKTAG